MEYIPSLSIKLSQIFLIILSIFALLLTSLKQLYIHVINSSEPVFLRDITLIIIETFLIAQFFQWLYQKIKDSYHMMKEYSNWKSRVYFGLKVVLAIIIIVLYGLIVIIEYCALSVLKRPLSSYEFRLGLLALNDRSMDNLNKSYGTII